MNRWIIRLASLLQMTVQMTARLGDRLRPPVLLAVRLTMARIFFLSGLRKLEGWDSTVSLFAYEYKLPLLPPELAAALATATELICPLLLAMGLAARLATLPMLAMTAVIQLTYLQSMEHLYWALLLAVVLTMGPGAWSVDSRLRKRANPLQIPA